MIAEMTRHPDAPNDEIIGGNLLRPCEMIKISAAAKSGKSWLLQQLAVSVSVGQPWLGIPTRACPALLVDAELQPHSLRERLRIIQSQTAGSLANLSVVSLRGRRARFGEFLSTLDQLLHRQPFGLVVIDSISALLSMDSCPLLRLAQIADRCECAVVVGDHDTIQRPGKVNSQQPWVSSVLSPLQCWRLETKRHAAGKPFGRANLHAACTMSEVTFVKPLLWANPLWVPMRRDAKGMYDFDFHFRFL